jgi:hypothetical protein
MHHNHLSIGFIGLHHAMRFEIEVNSVCTVWLAREEVLRSRMTRRAPARLAVMSSNGE